LKSRRVEDRSFFFAERGERKRDFIDSSNFGIDVFSSSCSFFFGFFKIDFKGEEEFIR
jgi:hypothetical protein